MSEAVFIMLILNSAIGCLNFPVGRVSSNKLLILCGLLHDNGCIKGNYSAPSRDSKLFRIVPNAKPLLAITNTWN